MIGAAHWGTDSKVPSHFHVGGIQNRNDKERQDFNGHAAEILLIEDNEGDAVLTEEALLESRIRISLHTVHDGVEALAFLRRSGAFKDAVRPDLILLDLNMPRMDGREFLQIAKRDPELSSIPVVVLTTSEAEQDIVESYALQASCFVTKPVDFKQFQKIVRELSEFWFTVVRLPAGV